MLSLRSEYLLQAAYLWGRVRAALTKAESDSSSCSTTGAANASASAFNLTLPGHL